MRSSRAASALLASILLAAGCGGEDERPDAPAAVRANIASFDFLPDPIEVRAGGTVTWTNRDRAPHTAEQPGRFDTGRLDPGDAKRVTFDEPGSYEYYCVFHRFMTGTVKVLE